MGNHNRLILTAMLVALAHSASSSLQVAASANLLDLSYLHRVKSTTLADAIKEAFGADVQDLDIDISSSMIRKDINDLLTALEGRESSSVRLAVRRNQWSPDEAATLLNAIVGTDNNTRKDEGNSNPQTKDDSEFNGKTSEKEGNQDPPDTDLIESMETVAPGFASIASLDLSWNDLSHNHRGSKNFLKYLQKTIQDSRKCPSILRFDVCGLGPSACRALGKGIIARYQKDSPSSMSTAGMIKPLSLYLTRNEAIGDSGLAALSAAIRTVTSKNKGVTVFEVLDLSGCGIGDTGAEALAIALENHPLCVRHLNLSNNQISDEGATALGRALLSSLESNNRCVIETLDLSHNNGIGDSGAKSIAGALEQGTVVNVILRSCHIHADGAASFAKSLRAIGHRSSTCTSRPALLRVDLSGNPLGILRKKSKSGAGKYSATALRSKASARTAAYMNLIGKTVQKGLKDLGISEGPDTLESDDDEEAKMKGEEDNDSQDPSKVKCGALAFADAFIDDEDDEDEGADVGEEPSVEAPADERVVCKIELGLRHCSFDTRAAEALAAVVLEAKSSSGMSMDLTIDARMNNVLEDETISALSGDSKYESDLDTMAETYHEAMEALRIARQRAQEAAKAAAARMKAEAEMDAAWGAPIEMRDDYDDDYQWDSDADYDDGEYSDFF